MQGEIKNSGDKLENKLQKGTSKSRGKKEKKKNLKHTTDTTVQE